MSLAHSFLRQSSRHSGFRSFAEGIPESILGFKPSHFLFHWVGLSFIDHRLKIDVKMIFLTSSGHLFIMLEVRLCLSMLWQWLCWIPLPWFYCWICLPFLYKAVASSGRVICHTICFLWYLLWIFPHCCVEVLLIFQKGISFVLLWLCIFAMYWYQSQLRVSTMRSNSLCIIGVVLIGCGTLVAHSQILLGDCLNPL